MPENNPITDAELAELDRWLTQANQPYAPRLKAAKRDAQAIVTRYMPGVLARLEAAERERDAMHAALSDIYWRSIPLGEDSGHSTISHIAADAMRGKNGNPLAARDAQQRREGAAEWLGGYLQGLSAGKPGAPGSMVAILEAELRRLREGGE